MSTIRISERTSVDEVIGWDLSKCQAARIVKRSSFEAGAQGLALASLAGLSSDGEDFLLDCDFEEPRTPEELNATLFSSAFGFAISRRAKRIHFVGKPAAPEFKPALAALYKSKGGVLGLGTARSLVCVDPIFPLPPELAEAGMEQSDEGFPAPSVFGAMLQRTVHAMGFRRLLGSAGESSVVSFIYEALRNSLEHGIPSDFTRRSRSTRALVVEKIVLQSSDVASRRLSPELKEYLARISEGKKNLGLGAACFTVADQGDGIQFTLPAKQDESAEQRLARAFQPGESRKPSGVVKRGLGLPAVVSAAHHLQALVRITSGNLDLTQDFSTGEHKYPTLEFGSVRELPSTFLAGTCVSIFLPEFSRDLDQGSLFGR